IQIMEREKYMSTYPEPGPCHSKKLSSALDRLDVVNAAAIPMRAEPAAIRCGEAVEQVGHWVIRTMRGDEVVARKRGPPRALAARHKDGLALFAGEPKQPFLDG